MKAGDICLDYSTMHLCGYSLVSKRYALAIYELKSVHLTLPSTAHSTESADVICELLLKLADVKLGTQIYFIGLHMSSQHLQFLTLESEGEIQQRWSHGGTLSRTTSFCVLGVYWVQKGLARSVVGASRSISSVRSWNRDFVHFLPRANEICGLLPKVAGFTSEEMSEFIKSSLIKELGFFSFLQNFRELRSISLDFTCPRSICSSSLLKVRVKFSSGRAMMELFLEIPAFVHEEASSSDESSSSDDEDSYAALTDTGMRAQSLFGCGCVWLLVLCLLRKCQPSLASVTITNSKRGETIYPVDELDPDVGMLDGDDVVTWE
ncbi:hypothetical protein SASPL_114053 [Salvia splendens]|uniref:Uncharacterized protein n=1 Tax=Salvia splendens TaxID=180675 RepID=A0A8X8XZZ5_SALSN|nr:hypothetical protein SASPL_114053 [Salvia splendens]